MQTQNLSIAQKYVCILVLSFSILLYESDILQSTSEVGLRQFFDVATRRHCGSLYLRIFRTVKSKKCSSLWVNMELRHNTVMKIFDLKTTKIELSHVPNLKYFQKKNGHDLKCRLFNYSYFRQQRVVFWNYNYLFLYFILILFFSNTRFVWTFKKQNRT